MCSKSGSDAQVLGDANLFSAWNGDASVGHTDQVIIASWECLPSHLVVAFAVLAWSCDLVQLADLACATANGKETSIDALETAFTGWVSLSSSWIESFACLIKISYSFLSGLSI